MTNSSRNFSVIDQICEQYVREMASLRPDNATYWGLSGYDHKWGDYSPAGLAALNQLSVETLTKLEAAPVQDETDRVTLEAFRQTINIERQLYQAGAWESDLNVIASPVQNLRDTFSVMDTSTLEGCRNVNSRLAALPAALAGYRESLLVAMARGQVASIRQVRGVIKQCEDMLAPGSLLDGLIDKFPADARAAVSADFEDSLQTAKAGIAEMAEFLRVSLAPTAPEKDACGRELYKLYSQAHVGAVVDLDEAYEWGRAELARIDAEQKRIAEELYGPGTSVREAMDKLNADPARQLHGTAALKEWMQKTADAAIAALDGTHFDIPEPVKTIECCIDDAGTGGIYYTGPTEDFSRPGRMWWSVPEGEDTFHTWQELTTVYHEGVPGHHLQIGQATVESRNLNRWRSQVSWNSGFGEGWALYAEALMGELGFQEDLGNRMGMLDSERLRAARVMLDIGVHLEKRRPQGESTWDADFAWDFLKENVAMADGFLKFELDRYLGWPGQAPSYKLGQKLWTEMRRDYMIWAKAAGAEATEKAFHTKALRLGGLPMATLRAAVLR